MALLLLWPQTQRVGSPVRSGSTELELFVEAAVHGDPERFGQLLGTVTGIVLGSVVDVVGEKRAHAVARAALIEVWRSAPLLDSATVNADAWVRHIVRAQAAEWARSNRVPSAV